VRLPPVKNHIIRQKLKINLYVLVVLFKTKISVEKKLLIKVNYVSKRIKCKMYDLKIKILKIRILYAK